MIIIFFKLKLTVTCDDYLLDGFPLTINVKADTSKIQLIAKTKQAAIYEQIELCVRRRNSDRTSFFLIVTEYIFLMFGEKKD
jgi:hypothetical protein